MKSEDLELRALAMATEPEYGWYEASVLRDLVFLENVEYIAAASPKVILSLLERLEKAEKDAERLNWLDKNGGASGLSQTSTGWRARLGLSTSHFDNIRLAIDAAMEARK